MLVDDLSSLIDPTASPFDLELGLRQTCTLMTLNKLSKFNTHLYRLNRLSQYYSFQLESAPRKIYNNMRMRRSMPQV